MLNLILASVAIFFISITMAMVGRGGGNFYVPVIVALGLSIYQAATTGQFILISSAVASAIVYQKHRNTGLEAGTLD